MATASNADVELADFVAEFYADPLGFVLGCYPWGEAGTSLADHKGPDKWQERFLGDLGDEVRANAFDGQTPVRPIRRAVSSGHGIGKALSKRTEVPTPTGMRRFGDLKPGDMVLAEDGTPTRVDVVFDQGERPIYRVTLDDGTEIEADAEHRWKVRGRQERRKGERGWRVMTTSEILAAGVTRPNGVSRAKQWEVPTQGAAQFESRPVPIDPYVLGAWLGDGGRLTSNITSADPEVIERLRAAGETLSCGKQNGKARAWCVSKLRRRLSALGISALYSYQKSVPAIYKENSADVRAEVLRGLLDTDGECATHGSVIFSSCSETLARDVVWLARSLGGKAQIQPTAKRGAYRKPDGRLIECRPCWRATITMPAGFRSFYVERKQERVRHEIEDRYRARWIASIEPIGEMPAQCITVEHPSHCFLANDFVVTHNSVKVAWLTDWIMSTRPHARGTITANTFVQLQTRTWAAIKRWTSMCLTSHWFQVGDHRMYQVDNKDSWFCAPQSPREENSEAFAGQHAADSTSFYIFDEDSAIPDKIHEVAEGGLTDGEPMIFLFGNPTRSNGHFHRACFGSDRDLWSPTIVDSRDSKFTNKTQLEEWVKRRGEDSDFVRVRVRGLPPNSSDLQFIGLDLISAAQKVAVAVMDHEPLVAGLDLARGGSDECVIRFRRGRDARSIPPIRVPGEQAKDSMKLATMAADVLDRTYDGRKVEALFVDATGGSIGGPVADRLRQLGHKHVFDVQFGGESPDPQYANMRAYMWARMRDWLSAGGAIDSTPDLEMDLTGPGYEHDKRDRVLLESKEDMKERGLDSPDDGDALALTFAAPVGPAKARPKPEPPRPFRWG